MGAIQVFKIITGQNYVKVGFSGKGKWSIASEVVVQL